MVKQILDFFLQFLVEGGSGDVVCERIERELGYRIKGEVSVDFVDHWFGDGYF